MSRAICLVVCATLAFAPSAYGCQQCLIWQVSTVNGRIVDVYTGDPVSNATIKLRKAEKRKPGEPRPQILACSASYRKGRVAYSGKTDADGKYKPGKMKPGYYWLVVKGQDVQLVQLIFYEPDVSKQDSTGVVEYKASETGYVGNMCEVEKTEDFL